MSDSATRNDKPRLLIVEDNAVNQRLAQKAVSKLGFESDVSEDGQHALTAIQQKKYALILMDCMMPVMNGYEATQAIRDMENQADQKRIPIIAFTADTTDGNRERCIAAGMDDYLTKPLRMERLQKALHQWLPIKK